MAREIVLDTEPTGFEPTQGHRLVEIACLEIDDFVPTGRSFHTYIDPCRDMPPDAERVHGLSAAFLKGKPRFEHPEVVDAFLEFCGDAPLIAHNAGFDRNFINHELGVVNPHPLHESRWIDTLALAKARFPGMPNSLDALCKRFSIDLSARTTHNALLDCRLLADVYVELTGGRQRGLSLAADKAAAELVVYTHPGHRTPRPMLPSAGELAAHAVFIARLKDPVWTQP